MLISVWCTLRQSQAVGYGTFGGDTLATEESLVTPREQAARVGCRARALPAQSRSSVVAFRHERYGRQMSTAKMRLKPS